MKRSLNIKGASTSKGKRAHRIDMSKKHHRQSLVNKIKIFDGCFTTEEHLYYCAVTLPCGNISGRSDVNEKGGEVFVEIYENFLNAGANIIRTTTTGAFFSVMKLSDQGITEEKYKKTIKLVVEIANTVVNEHNKESDISWEQAMVVGSCGHFEPTTEMTRDEVKNEYQLLINALSGAEINTFCLQDIQSTNDADMLVELLKELPENKRSAFMMFQPNSEGFLNDGTKWTEAAFNCYNKISLIAVGISCVCPANALKCVEMFKEKQILQKEIPLVVCTTNPDLTKQWQPIVLQTKTPAIEWEALGIRYIGGCCDVNAENIQCIRDELKRYNGTSV